MSRPFITYVSTEQEVKWSPELEELHEESSRTCFIDVSTRRAILGEIGEYVGRIYDESRSRPKYILESRYGWDDHASDSSTVGVSADTEADAQ